MAHLEFSKEITARLGIDPYNEFISAGRIETLTQTVSRRDRRGDKGQMTLDPKEHGRKSGIRFVEIADRVEVNVEFEAQRTSTRTGPAVVRSVARRFDEP